MNSCFAHSRQSELDDDDEVTEQLTPRNSVDTFCTSFDSKASKRYVPRQFRPTVLKIGLISGTKKRDGRMMSAQRIGRGKSGSHDASTLDFSFLHHKSSSDSMAEASYVEDDDDDESVEYDCVEYKLHDAMRLKTARGLGIAREVLTLANYSIRGEQYVVKELVKSALGRYSDESRDSATSIVDRIRSFAADVDADFDEAVKQYANELCDDNRDNIPRALHRARTLFQWCTSPAVKCGIVLKMLRIALVSVQRPPDITLLAKDAIAMAVDESVKSELQEASRLLAIDSLVRNYCGNGAQEFFRVSDPSHGLKLVHHVCRHIDVPTVLSDILMLCDAFTHVSKLDACLFLIQRTMVTPIGKPSTNRAGQCASFLREIYSVDATLAEAVGERMAAFCAGVVEDCNKKILLETFVVEAKRQAKVACSTACAMLSVMRDQAVIGKPRCQLLLEFQKMSKLQGGDGTMSSGCDIFMTLEELRDPSCCAVVVSDLLQSSVDLLSSRRIMVEMEDDSLRDGLRPLVANARQWCAILCDTPSQVSQMWSRAVGVAACRVAMISTKSLLLLDVSGVLHERTGHPSFHAIMSVALTLCARSLSEAHHLSRSMTLSLRDESYEPSLITMKSVAQASQLLREHVLLHSPICRLSSSLSLANLTELVCEVTVRSDMGIGERLERYIDMLKAVCRKVEKPVEMFADKRLLSAPNLHPTWYIGDGLLLKPLEALNASMSNWKIMLDIESGGYSKSDLASSFPLTENSQIVHCLESSGAHATSHRVIMLSVATSLCQSSLPCRTVVVAGDVKNVLINNYRVLAERSLGGTESGLTSGTIDAQMSVSFLLHLPKEMAFKVSVFFMLQSLLLFYRHYRTNFLHSRSTKQHYRRLSASETSLAFLQRLALANTAGLATSLPEQAFHGASSYGSSSSVMNFLAMLLGGAFSQVIEFLLTRVSFHNRKIHSQQWIRQCKGIVKSWFGMRQKIWVLAPH